MRIVLRALFVGLMLVSQLSPGSWNKVGAAGPMRELEGGVRHDTLEGSVSHEDRGRGVVGMRFSAVTVRPILGVQSSRAYVVRSLVRTGPAEQAGVQKGDRILLIDGVPTRNLSNSEVVRRILGVPGTRVTLTLQRKEEQLNVSIIRGDLDQLPDPEHRAQLLKQVQDDERSRHLGDAGEMASLGGRPRVENEPPLQPVVPSVERVDAVEYCRDARVLIDREEYAEAAKKLRHAIDSDPTYAEAFYFYGMVLDKMGRVSDAAEHLLRCLQIDPSLPSAWHALGAVRQRQGRFSDAVAAFKKYMLLSPTCPDEDEVRSTISALENEIAHSATQVSLDADEYLAETTQIHFFRWPERRMPLKVFIMSGTSVAGFQTSFAALLKQAFADWAAASDGHVQFTFVDAPRNADIECVWTDQRQKLRYMTEGGEAKVIWHDHDLLKATIILLTVRGKDNQPVPEETLRAVALHEVGHALGLNGHSSNPRDAMFMAGFEGRVLSSRDKKTLVALYTASISSHNSGPWSWPTFGFGRPLVEIPQARKLERAGEDSGDALGIASPMCRMPPEAHCMRLQPDHLPVISPVRIARGESSTSPPVVPPKAKPPGIPDPPATPEPPKVPEAPSIPEAPTFPEAPVIPDAERKSNATPPPGALVPPSPDTTEASATAQWGNASWAEQMSAGAFYASTRRRALAAQLFNMALTSAQKDASTDTQREMFTYEGLADLSMRLGNYPDTEKYLKLAIAADPGGQRRELRKKIVAVCKVMNKLPDTELQVAGQQQLRAFYSSSDYDRYSAAVSSACSKTWKPPRSIDPMPLTAVFWIDPNGAARDTFIQQSSGHGKLDQSLLEAVQKQHKFPPVPPGAPERMFMQIHWAPGGMTEEQRAIRGHLWGF